MLKSLISVVFSSIIVLGNITGCLVKSQNNRNALELSNLPVYSENDAKKAMAKEKNGITIAVDGNCAYKILYEK